MNFIKFLDKFQCPDSRDMESSGAEDTKIVITNHKLDQTRLGLIKLYKNYPILWDHTHPDFENESAQKLSWNNFAEEAQIELISTSRSMEEMKYLHNLYLELRKKLTAEEIRADNNLPKWFHVADTFLGPSMVESCGVQKVS
jgi:hypothetical protein